MQTGKLPIVIMGATASGKTEIALRLARMLKGEIVSVDSRQVYKFLQAGLAKPKGSWKKQKDGNFYKVSGINYHLVDTLNPNSTYDAGAFCKQAKKIAKEINLRNNTAIMAGGTGLYIQSYFIGLDKLPKADENIRKKITRRLKKTGNIALHKKLQKIDPVSAGKIPPQNTQRLIRAIEVYELTGRPISSFHTKSSIAALPSDKTLFVLLNWNKKLLHDRIKIRTENIFDDMVKETKNLLKLGYKPDCPALKSLGYREILDYINGRLTRFQTIEKIVKLTKAYAKRQATWFKRYKNVFTIDINDTKEWNPKILAEKIAKIWKRQY
jgi:tRNA dimethylallyltransferase